MGAAGDAGAEAGDALAAAVDGVLDMMLFLLLALMCCCCWWHVCSVKQMLGQLTWVRWARLHWWLGTVTAWTDMIFVPLVQHLPRWLSKRRAE